MGRDTATVNYALGSLFGNTLNMYIYGSGILTSLQFVINLFQTQSIDGAAQAAIEYFIQKLTPFPLNEFLTAGGFEEVLMNMSLALGLGILFASYKYRKNRYPG